jgi:hypothetical protein
MWTELNVPFKHEPESSVNRLSQFAKDIERVFGILFKKRFMILKHWIHLRRLESIEHLFLACTVLHNMLIDYDGHNGDCE